MAHFPKSDVAIVGAGASGVLLANALVRSETPIDVVLIDPRPGRGVAYGGSDPHHLLNTRVGNMSIDAPERSGFLDWLNIYRPRPEGWDVEDFAPRSLFGDYLEQRLANLADRTPGLGVTRVVRSRAVAAEQSGDSWVVRTEAGERIQSETLVLATGLARPRPLLFHGRDAIEAFVQDDPWDDAALKGLPAGQDVLLVGSGLTALDVAAAIWRRHPETRIVAVSRHGLLPRVHASPAPSAPVLERPYPPTARDLFGRLRAAAEFVEGDASLRHGVFLGLREIGAELWAALPDDERLAFLRHFRRYWEVERHRAPPAQAETVSQAMADGRFEVVRGRLAEARLPADGTAARVALLGPNGPRALTVGRVINCAGPEPNVFRSRNALLLDLLAQGVAAADPLGLGLHVGDHSAVFGARGEPTEGLYALGPLTQGQLFEITSVAEIRVQAEQLAGLLLARQAARRAPGLEAAPALRAISPGAASS